MKLICTNKNLIIKELCELFDQNGFKSGLNDTGVNIIALALEGTISTVRE